MKKLSFLTGNLALAALLLTAQAQVPAPPRDNAQPAKPAPKPKLSKVTGLNDKALGRKMVEKSKPTDMLVPPPLVKPRP